MRSGSTRSTPTPRPSPSTSGGYARRSRPTRHALYTSRPCGAWAIGSSREGASLSGRVVTRIRVGTGSLARQFALVVAVAVAPVLMALVVVGWLMVVSGHAAVLVAAIVVGAGAVAVLAAKLVADGILGD